MAAPIEVRHNEADHQFESEVEGGLARVTYHRAGNRITLIHTEVPEEAEGKGIAGSLVKYALSYARDQKLRVVAQCAYVAGYVKRHQDEYADLLETS